MPVHFNELKGIENANDGKINLTNLRADNPRKNKSPCSLNTPGCTRVKTKCSPIHALSLTATAHICSHTHHEITIIITLTKMQICCTSRRNDSQETRTRRRVLVFPRTKQSKVWGVEPKAVNTSLRFLIWYTTPVQHRRRHVDKTRNAEPLL